MPRVDFTSQPKPRHIDLAIATSILETVGSFILVYSWGFRGQQGWVNWYCQSNETLHKFSPSHWLFHIYLEFQKLELCSQPPLKLRSTDNLSGLNVLDEKTYRSLILMNKIEVNLLYLAWFVHWKKVKTINHFEVKLLNYGIETLYLFFLFCCEIVSTIYASEVMVNNLLASNRYDTIIILIRWCCVVVCISS